MDGNISSYGEKYYDSDNLIDYKKNHKDAGFEEPIYSFISAMAN